jgi:DnaK suppressor protein
MVKKQNKRQEELRRMLHQKREDVVREIENHLGPQLHPDVRNRIDSALDSGDMATLDLGAGVDNALLEMRYKTYKEIAEAFRRLENGTYGICASCGTEIPTKRLEAIPSALYCRDCQERQEELEKVEKEEERFE